MSRSERKMQHIRYALETGQERTTGFEDVHFIHRSIPDIGINAVRLDCQMGELFLSSPIFINAMTGGGGEQTYQINRDLAIAANDAGVGIAVGSQMSALRDESERKTFKVVREVNPKGIILANLGAEASVDEAKAAIDMIEANAIQLHLNVVQELTMPEGDRDFTGALKRIEAIVKGIDVPVIAKEVGFGMSKETVSALSEIGVSTIDVGGYGGTNFARIENQRRTQKLNIFDNWGIPTAISIAEAGSIQKSISIVASGGIQSSLEIAKSISMGAHAVGIAGYFLKTLVEGGRDELTRTIMSVQEELVYIMAALGTQTISDLRNAPLIINGPTFHWLQQRGIDTKQFSQR